MSPKFLKKQVALATFRRLLKIYNNKHTGLDVSFDYLKIFSFDWFVQAFLLAIRKTKKSVKSCLFRHTNMVSPFFSLLLGFKEALQESTTRRRTNRAKQGLAQCNAGENERENLQNFNNFFFLYIYTRISIVLGYSCLSIEKI